MNSAVCTLFEGAYHYGVAGLANSLFDKGYRGNLYVGYHGDIPGWANSAEINMDCNWPGCRILEISKELKIHFLPVETDFHFTNYKSHFMLDLWNGPAKDVDNLFYFDPDIINKCAWTFYERWVSYGVALIHEVVWNDMPANHPKRMQWKKVAEALDLEIVNHLSSYINAGFIGVSKKNIAFLKLWKSLINFSIMNFSLDKTKLSQSNNDYSLFKVADQDLLNITAMCTNLPLSEMGPEAMDFTGGGYLMSHATGTPKPWKKNFFLSILKGITPSNTDKLFWKNCYYPIPAFSKRFAAYKYFFLQTAAFIGRFYRKA